VVASGEFNGTLTHNNFIGLVEVRVLMKTLIHLKTCGSCRHPYNHHRVLVAAMHGGCRVMNIKGFDRYCRENPSSTPEDELQRLTFSSSWDSSALDGGLPMYGKVKKKFCEHESMVYGAAWLACRHPCHPNSYFEAAASCSFYDRSIFLWDSVF